MGKRPDKSLGEKAEPEASKTLANSAATGSAPPQPQAGDSAPPSIEAGGDAATNDLPMVEAPKLDGEETIARSGVEAVNESPNFDCAEAMATPDGEAVNETPSELASAAPAPQARSFRFALLAATIALAAALGSFLGALTASGIVRLFPADAPISRTADARDVLQALKAQLAELSAFKANLDGATRNANTQFAKIADRLDRVERAEADPAAKLAHIADTVDRLDKRDAAAPETTGSIAATPPPASEPTLIDRILDGWIVQDVRNGRAVVESRYGGVFVVGSGSFLPGLGRVEAVKRQDGEWVVVTARGLITSGR